jgi:hypothetical protein
MIDRYPPPFEQTDPAVRRVCWVLYGLAFVIVGGLIAYGCAS